MIGHTMLSTHDLRRAATFHDTLPAEIRALPTEIGAWRTMTFGRGCGCAASADKPRLGHLRFDGGSPAGIGSGMTIARSAAARDDVDRLYRKAPEPGDADQQPAGRREPRFCARHFPDLDGSKPDAFRAGGGVDVVDDRRALR